MKTKTITLYEFDELPEKVRAKVLERERYINVDDSWWSKFQLEEWEDKLKAMGFENPYIAYSGFGSQGDGASFTCKSVDIKAFIASQKAKGRFEPLLSMLNKNLGEINARVRKTDWHYCHEYTVAAEVEVLPESDYDERLYSLGDELSGYITETVRKLSKQIYRELESEYESLTSDEAVIDTIKANDYTFTESGRMEN